MPLKWYNKVIRGEVIDMIYILILVAKIFEVSMATIRIVLITKGERKIGAFIAFFEVSLWVILVSTVLDNIMGDPLKIVAYAAGFSIGNYLGSLIEEKIGIGLSEMQIIVQEERGLLIANLIREKGYAVTAIQGEGRKSKRHVLLMYIPRNRIKCIASLVEEAESTAVITVSDKKAIYGGFGMLRK